MEGAARIHPWVKQSSIEPVRTPKCDALSDIRLASPPPCPTFVWITPEDGHCHTSRLLINCPETRGASMDRYIMIEGRVSAQSFFQPFLKAFVDNFPK